MLRITDISAYRFIMIAAFPIVEIWFDFGEDEEVSSLISSSLIFNLINKMRYYLLLKLESPYCSYIHL